MKNKNKITYIKEKNLPLGITEIASIRIISPEVEKHFKLAIKILEDI